MFIRDNHLHTHHSYDSDANFTDYLTHFDGEIVTTEHYDPLNPYTKQDDVPDYESYSHEVENSTSSMAIVLNEASRLAITSLEKAIF